MEEGERTYLGDLLISDLRGPKHVFVRGSCFLVFGRIVKYPGVVVSLNAGADGGKPISEAILRMSLTGPPDTAG